MSKKERFLADNALRIGITGSSGLLGFHLKASMLEKQDVSVVCAERSIFNNLDDMNDFVSNVDVIVHLAYLNRGHDSEVASVNPMLAQKIVDACRRTTSVKQIVFSSSLHVYRETAYGKSKRECVEIFRQWALEHNGVFSNLIFPHVFGEYGKPFSNSVVSTFCYQIAKGERPNIDHDANLELLYAQDAASLIYDVISQQSNKDIVIKGIRLKVSEMLSRLTAMANSYAEGVIPDFRDTLSFNLFNTYRSFLFIDKLSTRLMSHEDNKGIRYDAVKSEYGGQASLSTTKSGLTREGIFHHHKIERLLVLKGDAVVSLQKLFSDQVLKLEVNGLSPQLIDIPTLCTYSIKNVGKVDLMTLLWSHEMPEREGSDIFYEPVYRDN